ncbi:hypothetical protein NDU88_006523 [Pleurodeles waltl]|uniref:Uncharacterized protein n=1 Tax=Pleurodeles waltl TaxID=8319 RepID=A0AAV7NTQ2_PLEWA|nr:hypothetical protein NDU88_006523 [Pleurodeles waltl]
MPRGNVLERRRPRGYLRCRIIRPGRTFQEKTDQGNARYCRALKKAGRSSWRGRCIRCRHHRSRGRRTVRP